VIAAKPGGGAEDENRLLVECLDTLKLGTDFVRFRRIATNLVTMPFNHSRLLQVADLVVSSSTALVAGKTNYSEPLVAHIRPMLRIIAQACQGAKGERLRRESVDEAIPDWAALSLAATTGFSLSHLQDAMLRRTFSLLCTFGATISAAVWC